MFAVMLCDQVGAPLGLQWRPLPHVLALIDLPRTKLFPEDDGLTFQLLDFDEHRYLRAPQTDTAKARGSTLSGVNLEGAILKNKGEGKGCQGSGIFVSPL
jgi:hypothetical protein